MPVVYVNDIKSRVFLISGWVMDGYKMKDKNKLLWLVVDFRVLINFLKFPTVCIYKLD